MQNRLENTETIDAIDGFRQILEYSQAWESGTVQVVAADLPDKWSLEGCLAQALCDLRTPEQESAFEDVRCILLSTQSVPLLPERVEAVFAQGASLSALASAIVSTPSRTAILLMHIENVWAGVANKNGATTKSWSNPTARMATPIERVEESLKTTITMLHTLAAQQGLTIVATSKLAVESWKRLEPSLSNLKDLSWCNMPSKRKYISDDWLRDRANEMKEGMLTMTELRQQFEQNLSEVSMLETSWAQALSVAGRHYDAWELMKPFAPQFGSTNVSQMIRLAQMATDAADAESALFWIKNARKTGIRIYQDWCCVVKLSQALGESELEHSLMEEMGKHFSDTPVVLDWQMRMAIASGDPGAAAVIARQAGNELRASLLEEIASAKIIAPDLLNRPLAPDDMAFALQSLANFLMKRGNLIGGFLAASAVPKGTDQEIPSLRVRWKALGALIVETDDPVELLNELIVATLPHSHNLELRCLINEVCEDDITPRSHMLVFTTLANLLFDPVLRQSSQMPWRGPAFDIKQDAPTSEITSFIKVIAQNQPSKIRVLGQTALPVSLAHKASPGIATALIRTMDTVEPLPSEPEPWMLMLMCIECISRHLGDPTTDMFAGYWLVKRTAATGDGQTARNIAEGLLQDLTKAQPSESQWRLGIAWLAMAESRASSGSPNEAMRHLCFALCCFSHGVRHVEVVADVFNLAARVMRDLKIPTLAEKALKVESELSTQHGDTYREERALDTIAMLDLHQLSLAPVATIARYLNRQMKRLRSLNESDDLGPILACIANAIRFLRRGKITLDNNIHAEISEWRNVYRLRQPERAKILDGLLMWPPQREWFIEQAKGMSLALRSEDMDGQLAKLSVMARDGFIHSCEAQIPSLALATGTLLCQPALVIRGPSRNTAQDRASNGLRRFLATREVLKLASFEVDDALKALKHRGEPRLHTMESALELSLEDVSASLRADEGLLMLILTNIKSNPIAALYISQNSVYINSRHMTIEGHWTEAAFNIWDKALHSPSPAPHLSDRTSNDQMQDSTALFSLCLDPLPPKLCIIPESDLFGFPFALVPLLSFSMPSNSSGQVSLRHADFRLGDVAELSTAPSIEYFIQQRRKKRVATGRWIAWSGKPKDTNDDALRLVNEHLPCALAQFNFELTIDGDPPSFDMADVGVMILHGHPNSWGELVALRHGGQPIVPEELGALVGHCGCFILGACYGSSSSIGGSQECYSAVSSVLAAGASCVIAPCFAVNVDFLLDWIAEFLGQLAVGVSAATAADNVNRVQSNLAGRTIMQVFGDGSFQLEPQSR